MDEITLPEMKKILLDLLDEYVKFCQRNQLRYFLAYGTLLGAVRHKGFIPWDDDIDIIMPRPDYNRFLELGKQGLGGNIQVHCLSNNPNYIYPFAKVFDSRTVLIESNVKRHCNELGVYIDIFPIDGLPGDEKGIFRHYSLVRFFKKIHGISIMSKSRWGNLAETAIKVFIKKICNLYGCRRIARRMDRLAQRYKFDDADKVGVVVWGFGAREATTKNIFTDSVPLKFEGSHYLAPSHCEEYLAALYGDYMQLPPVEKRVSHHSYRTYWKTEMT